MESTVIGIGCYFTEVLFWGEGGTFLSGEDIPGGVTSQTLAFPQTMKAC